MTSSSSNTDDVNPEMAESDYFAKIAHKHGINTDLRTAYKAVQQEWHNSRCQETFLSILQSVPSATGLQISKAVCMALGTLNNRLSLQQLVLFMDMVRFLEEQEGSQCQSIELFAQDPRFTDADKDFLTSLDFTILEAPNAERIIRRGVFSFVPVWVPEYQLLGRISGLQPSLHVGKFPHEIRHACACHARGIMKKLEPIKESRQLTSHEQSVESQAHFQFMKVKDLAIDYTFGEVHSCPLPGGKIFKGLYPLAAYVENNHDVDEMPDEITDSELLNIEEDTETCACCRAPPAELSSIEEEMATVDLEGK